MSEPYRVLALDGGGMRGIFTASVIAATERDLDIRVADHFDLIAGTSTGGIIGLGLAAGKSGAEMRDFYAREGQHIFQHPRRLRRPWRPKYDRAQLDHVLRREFGPARLNDLSTPVCVSAYELVAGTTRVWKDDHHGDLAEGGNQLVWKVAAATAAAPTYFAPVQIGNADSHIDGGIWANNPAMVGIVEAVRYADKALSDIQMISIGTTSKAFQVPDHDHATRMGALGWVREARHLLLGDGTTMGSDHQARLLLPAGAYLRLNHERSRDAALDDWRACASLEELGEQVARSNRVEIRRLLGLG